MKKYTLLYILPLLALTNCGRKNQPVNNQSVTKPAEAVAKSNIIHKDLFVVSEFTHLTIVSGADIHYTQGDYSIEAIGDSTLLEHIITEFDSSVLTINLGSERNPGLNVYEGKKNVRINISAPALRCVSLCSSGNFTTHGLWKGEVIELGIIGEGSFYCDSIVCNTFDLKSSNNGSGNFAYLTGKEVSFANLGNSNITANVDAEHFVAINRGNCTMTFTGRATTKEIYPTKHGKINFE